MQPIPFFISVLVKSFSIHRLINDMMVDGLDFYISVLKFQTFD